MQLEGVGVTHQHKLGPFVLRLKFGKQNYVAVELPARRGRGERGGEAAGVGRSGRGEE